MRLVLQALRALRFELWAWRVSRAGYVRLRQQKGRQLRAHLGCGADVRAGWLNIDLSRDARAEDFVNYDLRRGLPLPSGSCSIIYSSHFIEHLVADDARRLFADCYRVLEPGGVMRCSLPDFRAAFAAYAAGDMDWFAPLSEYCGARDTLIGYMEYVVYQDGEHRSLHDIDSLRRALTMTGFTDIEQVDFDPGIDPMDAMRRRFSLYMSAKKPS